MNVEELKTLVKSYFNLADKTTVKRIFAEATLADGTTKIYYEGDLAVGSKIFLLDAEGNEIPAPEGSHTLENGTNVVLGTEGEVLELTLAQPVEAGEHDKEEMIRSTGKPIVTPNTFDNCMDDMGKHKMDMPVMVEDIVKAVVEAVQEEMKKHYDRMSAVEAKVETFSAAPASEKTLPGSVKKATRPEVEPLQKERFERVLKSVKINRN